MKNISRIAIALLAVISLVLWANALSETVSYEDMSIEELESFRNELFSKLTEVNTVIATKLNGGIDQHPSDSAINEYTIASIFPDEQLALDIRDDLGKFSINDTVTPEELDSITKLSHQYDGRINSLEGISYLKNLEGIYISTNSEDVLSEELLGLTKLTSLIVDSYPGNELPAWITKLTSLEYMGLDYSDLHTLPDDFSNLANLKGLSLWMSNITELPDCLGMLTNLTYLNIGDSPFTILPDWIGNLLSLRGLDLRNSKIVALPETICNLTDLEELNLANSKIESLPESIGELKKLKFLNLSKAPISELPDSIRNLNIKRLYIDGTKIK